MAAQSRQATQYCLGLPLIETRPISTDERELLADCLKIAVKRRRITVAIAWTIPVADFLLLWLATAVKDSQPTLYDVLSVLAIVGIMIAPAIGILMVLDAKKRLKLLRKSANATNVEIYRGETVMPYEDEVKETEIVRIPVSGLFVSHLSRTSRNLMASDIEVVAGKGPETIIGDQRELNPDELAELRRLTEQFTKVAWWTYALFAYVSIGAVSFLWNGHELIKIVACVFHATVAVYILYSWIQTRLVKKMMEEDLETGVVTRTAEDGQTVERLSASHAIWTIDGMPAPLRTEGKGPRRV